MLAKRLRTLSIFAGGCLSGAVLIIVWHSAPQRATDGARARQATPSVEAPGDAEAASSQDADRRSARNAHEEGETSEPSTAKHAPAPAKNEDAEAPAAEAGRSVSDVLARLEAAYRQQLAAVPASAGDAPAGAGALAPTTSEPQSPAAAPTVAALSSGSAPAAPPAGPAAPARAEAPVAVAAATPAAAAVPPVALAAPAVVAPAVAAPAVAAPATPAPVAVAPTMAIPGATSPLATAPGVAPTQNVSVGSIHQGDTYHVQQVAVMQYVPMFMPLPYPGYGYPQPTHPRSMQPRRVPYPTTLTNPDNPWGFNFPPSLEMVK